MAAACLNTCLELIEQAFSEEQKSNYFSKINNLIKGIQDDRIKFYECVERLGPYLTDTDVTSRTKGVEMLKDIVETLPRNFLNDDEVGKLAVFFSDRLKDSDSVVSQALLGLVTLSTNERLTSEGLYIMLNGVFQDVYTQTRLQKDRYCVLILMKNALQFHLEDIKTMGFDFVNGFIQTIDGEKDPRNLVVVFNLIPIVIRNFNINSVVEELFDVCGRYFPIDYFPPKDDPRGITREDLLLGLRSCFASTPLFAEYCLPLLLEKLDSALDSAKLDSLQTLTACVDVYGLQNLKPFYSDIWKSIRREIFSSANIELEKAGLNALSETLMTLVAGGEEKSTDEVSREVLTPIIRECLSYFNLPDMKLYIPTAKLLKAITCSSLAACEQVLIAVMPFCLDTAMKEGSRREVFFSVINFLLEGSLMHHTLKEKNPLDIYKRQLLDLYIKTLSDCRESSLKLTLIRGLSEMTSVKFLFNETELMSVAERMAKCFVTEQQCIISLAYQNLLTKISEVHSDAMLPLLSKIISGIESGTFENIANGESNLNQLTLQKHLMLVVALLKSSKGVTVVIPTLLNKLKMSVTANETMMAGCLLECLIMIASSSVTTLSHSSFWHREVLEPLVQIIIQRSHVVDDFTLTLLQNVAKINQAIVPILDVRESSLMLTDVLNLYLRSDEAVSKPNSESRMFPLGRFSILLIESVISSVKKEVFIEEIQLSAENYDCFVLKIINIIKSVDFTDCEVASACRCISSLLNKLPQGELLDKQIDVVLHTVCHKNWTDSSVCVQIKQRLALLLMWCLKAKLLRGHAATESFLEELFRYLEDESVSWIVSEKCDLILGECPTALNVRLHCNIRCLYKQRLFVMASGRLIHGFRTSNEGIKYNYLTVLIKMTTELPKEVLLPEISSMLPVFIKGLASKDAVCLSGVLSLLADFVEQIPDLLGPYVDGLITHLLDLTAFRGVMKVRIMALTCLEKLTAFPTHITVKHKDEILSRLAACLDDHKRLVRRAAVAARCKWFLVGSPGGC